MEFIKNQLPEEQREKEASLRVICLELKQKGEGLKEEEFGVLREWTRVVAVCFEASVWPVAKSFWQHFGEGFSSRRADFCRELWDKGLLVEVDEGGLEGKTNGLSMNGSAKNGILTNGTATNGVAHAHEQETGKQSTLVNGTASFSAKAFEDLQISKSVEAKEEIRNRIAELYFSDAVNSDSKQNRKITDEQLDSVVLYPTGMSSLAGIHRSLLEVRGPLKSICFG